jgi:hypothetical protein
MFAAGRILSYFAFTLSAFMKLRLLLLWLFFQGSVAFGQEQNFPSARPLGFILPSYYEKATIPFQIYNNLIVIDVLLNRSLPLKFVLDTGVRTTVLTEKTLSDLLNLEYSRKITIPGVGGEKLVDAYVVNNVSLNIGEIQGEGHALLVLEKDFGLSLILIMIARKLISTDPKISKKREGITNLTLQSKTPNHILKPTLPFVKIRAQVNANL